VPKRGRGSGKSYFFADLLIEDHIRHKGTRAVCIREVQKTLAGSSKRPANSRRMPGMPSRLFVAPQQRAHRARDRRFRDARGTSSRLRGWFLSTHPPTLEEIGGGMRPAPMEPALRKGRRWCVRRLWRGPRRVTGEIGHGTVLG
jgi:hypothetical protein